jgi:transposase
VGLTPVPYQSGQTDREQGISKAGNKHVRGLIVEAAWLWLRWQPGSDLSRLTSNLIDGRCNGRVAGRG